MKSKKKFITFSILIVFILTLSSCNKNSSKDQATIEIFNFKPENVKIMKQLAADFEKEYPNIKVNINSPNKPTTVLRTRLAKNKIPDVIAYQGDVLYPELANAGMLTDVSSWDIYKNLPQAYKDLLIKLNFQSEDKEHAYGIPYALNANGVLYNKAIFEKYNLQIPKTWEEFLYVLKVLQDNGVPPIQLTTQTQWTTLDPWNAIEASLAPKDFWKDRWAGKTTFYDTHLEIAQKYIELTKYANKGYQGTTNDDGLIAFTSGKAAMMLSGNYVIAPIRQIKKDFPVGIFAMPASSDASKNKITSGIDVMLSALKDSKNQKEAKLFIEFISDKNNAQKYMDDQASFSPIQGTSQKDPALEAIAKMYETGDILPSNAPYYPASMMLKALTQEFVVKKNVSDFLKKLDIEFDSKSKLSY